MRNRSVRHNPRERSLPCRGSSWGSGVARGAVASLLILARCSGGGGGEQAQPVSCALKVYGGEGCEQAGLAVVELIAEDPASDGAYLCSGTFVSRRHVLTAAHCVVSDAGELYALSALVNGESVRPSAVYPSPRYTGGLTAEGDIAIVEFPTDLPVSPLPVVERVPAPGEAVTVFGYGEDENGRSSPERGGGSVKQAGLQVRLVQNGVIFAQSEQNGVCGGDSGGPLIGASAGGGRGILGVTSQGPAGRCVPGTLTIQQIVLLYPGVTDAELAALLELFPDGNIPMNLFGSLADTQSIAEIRSHVPGVQILD